MNYNKIEETIKAKNFQKTFFVEKVLGMTRKGFDLALARKTLKVRDLEKITEALKLPMNYWWEEDADLISLEPSPKYENIKAQKEMARINNELERCYKTIDNLNDHITALKQKLALSERQKSRQDSG